MSKKDIESVEQTILGIVQAALPAKLTEINTEKGDTLLTDIDNAKYFNDFYQEELTASEFIFYGIKEPDVKSSGCDTSATWKIFYHIFIQKENNLGVIRSAVLRYTRALTEVINEASDKISRVCSAPEIIVLTPEDVEDIINETPFKMGGIEFTITIS